MKEPSTVQFVAFMVGMIAITALLASWLLRHDERLWFALCCLLIAKQSVYLVYGATKP